MRILFLTRSFNSLAQRLYLDLTAMGHEVAVELDIADSVATEAVALFRPALVVAPFLQRAIPEAVWRHTPCLVVHPGIVGDRGRSVGIDHFGASADYKTLFEKFGITTEAVIAAARETIAANSTKENA